MTVKKTVKRRKTSKKAVVVKKLGAGAFHGLAKKVLRQERATLDRLDDPRGRYTPGIEGVRSSPHGPVLGSSLATGKLATGKRCKTVSVPPDACYVRFGPKTGKYKYSEDDWHTARGELMIVDFNADRQVIGIELVGLSKAATKACQEGPRRK